MKPELPHVVLRRTLMPILMAAVLLMTTGAAFAAKPVFSTLFGGAIRGYDPVAYFTEAKPSKGKSAYQFKWKEATWSFASSENRDLFAKNPEKYAPRYGGYCAWAVSEGYTASIDPNAWRIVKGKLYLNYSEGVQQQWEQDIPGNIAKADVNWPKILKGK